MKQQQAQSSPHVEPRKQKWGRSYTNIGIITTLGALGILVGAPLATMYCYTVCFAYDCAITGPFTTNEPILSTLWSSLPVLTNPNWFKAILVYFGWQIYQILFYLFFPSSIGSGQSTPAGHILKYRVNGFRMFVVTHVVLAMLVFSGILSPDLIFNLWGELLIIANVFGLWLSFFAYAKAKINPTHPNDCKFSGIFIYDFFMGAEMNPRIFNLDFKLYFNGRPGIGAWNLINLSFMAAQYSRFGFVSNAMVLVTLLQAYYIIDFFWNEDWYLRTIDIAHDHFGFYLAWGDSVWLPCMYTLQGFYLVFNPTQLSWPTFGLILLMGSSGYMLFRAVNEQKDRFRSTDGNCTIWGKKATYIETTYKTADGKTHKGKLLTSGFWGMARHFNYVGDLLLSLAFCLCCGNQHALPYFYIFYMFALLLHRTYRDAARLSEKYGPDWVKYCKAVPYKILPYVF